jgi:DNA-binding CsgD family transcriptional regulator
LLLQITPSERAALQLLANGGGRRELADGLRVSEGEVDVHLAMLFARMGASSQGEAVAAALRRGLVNTMAAPRAA